MKNALWIKGYKNLYQIFPDGKIISFKQDTINGKEVHPRLSGSGYYMVTLTNKKGIQKQLYLHNIIAEHYLINPNPKKLKYVGFKDSNPENVVVSNLIWLESNRVQYFKNRKKNFKKTGMITSKISEKQLIKIADFIKSSPHLNLEKIANLYGINRLTLFKLRQTPQFKKALRNA